MKIKDRTVEFKLLAGYSAVLIALIVTIILVLQIQLRSRLEEQTLKQVESNGAIIIAELVRRTTLVNTLTQGLASFASQDDRDADSMQSMYPAFIALPDSETFIAGGGYWPEPHMFSEKLERRSFFWGRNSEGELEYFDDYNDPEGPGYHHEEWYVPARYLTNGKCYWSRSYTDPYSGQPMVTCTVAAIRAEEFVGAATIDLRLDGLAEFFSEQTKSTGSYAFAVDQHNRFISFPDNSLISGGNNTENISVEDLAKSDSRFLLVANVLNELRRDIKKHTLGLNDFDLLLSQKIADDSYQIDMDQADIIAASLQGVLHDTTKNSLLLKRIEVDNDILLGEASTVSIFHVPDAYWKVVVVTPKSAAFADVQQFIEEILKNLLLPMLIIMAVALLGIRSIVLKPISSITNTLKNSVKKEGFQFNALDESRKDEFGQLAYWYNLKNKELDEVMKKLSVINGELSYQANYDSLTDLSNRRDFEQRLQSLISSKKWPQYSLLYLDMDQFKIINDTCGHTAGDQLLIQISTLLKQMIREGDSVARIGGDEFAIIAKTPNEETVIKMADRFIKQMSSVTFSWEGANFHITCSIGVLYLADIEADATQAMKLVDTACYAAKEAGRNRYHFYQKDDLASQRAGEMNWIARINSAFDNNLFVNEFQLIQPVSLNGEKKYCIESLVRMKNSDGSLIPPGAFLPAAERYNTISRIDRWVISNTLMLLSDHRSILDNIRFCSINLSGDSVCSEGLVEYILDCMEKYSIPAENICFEITETQAMLNMSMAIDSLAKIRELGCLVALDDFGSGMSSYGYLTQLPVNFLKIDGGFVRNITSNNIHLTFVKSMGDISKAMKLETIAEFVEDIETYDLLKTIGIDYAQGYGIAKPLPIEEVMDILNKKVI